MKMKVVSSVLVCASLMSVLLMSSGAHAVVDVKVKGKTSPFKETAGLTGKTDSLKEDDAYWARLMQESMSVAPTPSPTVPSLEECLVEVTVTCTGTGGVDCNDLPPVSAQCTETEFDTVSFIYNYRSCDDEDNGQEESSCEDSCSLEDEDTVSISCVNDAGEVIFSGTTAPGEEITLPSEDIALTAEVTCDMGTTDGNICQVVSIDTSGDVDLQLKDTFGSLELVSCGDNDCLEDVTYTYTLENIGEVCMEITVVERTRNGETENLIGLVSETNLCPGETTTVTEVETIDLCEEDEICTVVDVEADPPSGVPCLDSDEYCLIITAQPTEPPTTPATPAPTAVPATPAPTVISVTPLPTLGPTDECDITIDIACIPIETDAEGNATSCEQLPPLTTLCEERPNWMQFKYYGGSCNNSANMQDETRFFCIDEGPIPQDEPVYIQATGKDNMNLTFFEGVVEIDETYNVTDPMLNRLPTDMDLIVSEVEVDDDGEAVPGDTLQFVRFHSSCSQNLFLKDRFGAHQLVGFFNPSQGLVDCFITSNYTFTFGNMGTAPANLESLIALTTPFGPFNLTDDVLGQELAPGDEFVAYLPIELDLTVRQRYTVLATITGSFTDDTPTCSSSDFLDFVAGNPLPPSIPTFSPTTAGAGAPDAPAVAPAAAPATPTT